MATWSSDASRFEPFVRDVDAGPAVFRLLEAVDASDPEFDPAESATPPLSPAEARVQLEAQIREELEAGFQARRQAEDAHLHSIADTLATRRQETLDGFALQAARLALAAARRVVRREIETDPDALVAPLRDALWKVADGNQVVLRVNPEDAARLRANPGFLAEIGAERLEEDRRIERGGCVVEDGARGIDLQLETQLEAIAEAIDAALETP